jgi:hypothetical protein
MQGVNNALPLSLIQHKPRLLQQIQMVGYTGLADLKMLSDVARAHAFLFQKLQYFAPGRISQGFEGIIQSLLTPLDI